MLFIYSIAVFFYGIFIKIAALFSLKAKRWVEGRKKWENNLRKNTPSVGFDLWMHCSSLGEFEQGRPVLESYKLLHPNATILLSFFSPSGYEIRKNYAVANYVAYLPLDTKNNAQKWLNIVQPKKTIFVKYDFWFNFLKAIEQSSTHAILISALFHETHFFNTRLGKKFSSSLTAFDAIFFQKPPLFQFNKSIVSKVTGDTRVDRVLQIQKEKLSNDSLKNWSQGKPIMVWGSVWESDLFALKSGMEKGLKNWKHIIAPHEPDATNIKLIQEKCISPNQLFSEALDLSNEVIIVDSIGQLSGLYQYGAAAYIGGGFGQGIHNTLEPMAASCPVIIGPKYYKFPEAIEGIKAGAIWSVNNETNFLQICQKINEPNFLKNAQKASANYISSKAGATKEIIEYLELIA